jgi:hypothetical protein
MPMQLRRGIKITGLSHRSIVTLEISQRSLPGCASKAIGRFELGVRCANGSTLRAGANTLVWQLFRLLQRCKFALRWRTCSMA